MDQKKIGKFIASLRKEKNMTQEMLAEELFVDRATISKWETGTYIANPEILMKLGKIFDVSVNEILVGERINKENEEQVNNVSIELIKNNRNRIKRITNVSTLIILMIVFMFLSYYFVNNYNSISVYKITGENKNFFVSNGLMVFSKEKAYINLGELGEKKAVGINGVRLYYIKNQEEKDLFSSNNSTFLIINNFGNDEIFNYNDLKYIKKQLFLEVELSNNEKEIIELEIIRDFSNINIFNNKHSYNNNEESENIVNNLVPKYILDNFEFNSSQNEYYLNKYINNVKVNQKYLVDISMYIVDEEYKNYVEHYEYMPLEQLIVYNSINKDNVINNSFSFDILNENCVFGNCDLNKVNYFSNKYLETINFERK